MNQNDNIPESLNSPAQARANSHDQHTPAHTPAQPITPVGSAGMALDAIRGALPYLTGEAELAARRQLAAGEE